MAKEKERDTKSQVTLSGRGFLKLCEMQKAGRFHIYRVNVLAPAKYRCFIGKAQSYN